MVDKIKIQRFLLKINRYSAWLLLPVIIIYLISGFAMTGRYGFNKLINARVGLTLHNFFHLPLIILFVIHVGISIYFASKRWKIFKKKRIIKGGGERRE